MRLPTPSSFASWPWLSNSALLHASATTHFFITGSSRGNTWPLKLWIKTTLFSSWMISGVSLRQAESNNRGSGRWALRGEGLSAVVLRSGGLRSRHIFKLVHHACRTKHPIIQNIFNSGFYKNGNNGLIIEKNGSPYIWAINSTLPYKRVPLLLRFSKDKMVCWCVVFLCVSNNSINEQKEWNTRATGECEILQWQPIGI